MKEPNFELDENINIREVLEQYLYYWKWFILSTILALAGAYFYLKYAEKQYSASSKILITEPEGLSGELLSMKNFSLLSDGTNVNVEDQIEVIKSRRLMTKVVDKLKLNISYTTLGRIGKREVLLEDSPIKVTTLTKDLLENNSTEIIIKLISLTQFEYTEEGEREKVSSFGKKIKTRVGDIVVLPNNLKNESVNKEFSVFIRSVNSTVSYFINKVEVKPTGSKSSNVIALSLTDNVKKRAQYLIDELVNQYNQDAIYDKKLIGDHTSKFIEERLALVSGDLEGVDKNLEAFKKSNNVTDVASEAQLNLQSSQENQRKLLDYTTQLQMVDFMDDFVRSNNNELIPANIGLNDQSIIQNTQKYNELVLARKDLLKGATNSNPIVQNLNKQIAEVNNNLVKSINNYKKTTQIAVRKIESQGSSIQSKIKSFPGQERKFRDISRQQQIVEALYLFLLQKREETEIANASTPSSMKIIDKAYVNNTPVFPKPLIIYLGAFILGLAIPFGLIYSMLLLDNKIHNRKDVEKVLQAPIIGDIPSSKEPLIKKNDNGKMAEAFRILRTNLNFFLSGAGAKEEAKNIFLSSTISGEGKTFVATNLAIILNSSTTKKNVLLIEADIRSPKVFDFLEIKQFSLGKKGITHYLMDDSIQVEDLIIKDTPFSFDLISAGIIAPNPSELLMNGRFSNILEYAKDKYDYVIVDTAPVGLVTDTILIAKDANLFIYITRANYLDKRLLEVPKGLYADKKLSNMAVLVNDVDGDKGGYGYGYGYGNYVKKEPFWKRIFRKN